MAQNEAARACINLLLTSYNWWKNR